MDFSGGTIQWLVYGDRDWPRDLGDTGRYNVLPELAERMGLLQPKKDRLWKDRALVELNEAVLHSFIEDGVRIVDHHRASSEFMRFVSMEKKQGRLVSGNWSWLVPPMSGSATEVFHHNWKDQSLCRIISCRHLPGSNCRCIGPDTPSDQLMGYIVFFATKA